MSLIRRVIESVGVWVPVLIAVLVAVLAVALMFLFHLYRVSGLRWSEAAADWGQILTLDNILLGLLILVIAAGFANISGRR
jgi:hypothetical protein